MAKKSVLCCMGFLSAALLFPARAWALVVLNEFLADPPAGIAGDANRDGVRSSSQDEFVELLNIGEAGGDLSLWSLWDSIALRHAFPPGTELAPWGRLVIFGGGSPLGIPGFVTTASSGSLSLNNSGDEIVLKDSEGKVIDRAAFSSEADQDQSLARFPEGTGSFQPHRSVSSRGLLFSPGTDPQGESQRPAATPEPASGALLGVGLVAVRLFKRRRIGFHAG